MIVEAQVIKISMHSSVFSLLKDGKRIEIRVLFCYTDIEIKKINIYSKKKKKIHSWTTFIAAMLATQNDFKD